MKWTLIHDDCYQFHFCTIICIEINRGVSFSFFFSGFIHYFHLRALSTTHKYFSSSVLSNSIYHINLKVLYVRIFLKIIQFIDINFISVINTSARNNNITIYIPFMQTLLHKNFDDENAVCKICGSCF